VIAVVLAVHEYRPGPHVPGSGGERQLLHRCGPPPRHAIDGKYAHQSVGGRTRAQVLRAPKVRDQAHSRRPAVPPLRGNPWSARGSARQEIVLPAEIEAVLSIGAESHLWDSFLIGWLGKFRDAPKDVAVRAEIGDAMWLTRQLTEGLLDLAITYRPNEVAFTKAFAEPFTKATGIEVAMVARPLFSSAQVPNGSASPTWSSQIT
jgi:hypothetical protein